MKLALLFLVPFVLLSMSAETAGEYLGKGMAQFSQGLWKKSAESLEKAIKTGYLNDAGRALCYYTIGQAYIKLDEEDNAAEALLIFSIISEDIIEENHHKEFIKNFDLKTRIKEAQLFVEAVWLKKRWNKTAP